MLELRIRLGVRKCPLIGTFVPHRYLEASAVISCLVDPLVPRTWLVAGGDVSRFGRGLDSELFGEPRTSGRDLLVTWLSQE